MRSACIAVLIVLSCAAHGAAQSDTATLTTTLTGLARLSLSSTTLIFPDANPNTIPQVPASQGPITVTTKARASATGTVTLTVAASADLRSSLDTIPASALTWTVTGPGFVAGTLSTTPQMVGSWTGSGVRVGTQSFFFQNLWTYATGTYTVTLDFTLTAP